MKLPTVFGEFKVIQQVMRPEKRGRMTQIMKNLICQDRASAFISQVRKVNEGLSVWKKI